MLKCFLGWADKVVAVTRPKYLSGSELQQQTTLNPDRTLNTSLYVLVDSLKRNVFNESPSDDFKDWPYFLFLRPIILPSYRRFPRQQWLFLNHCIHWKHYTSPATRFQGKKLIRIQFLREQNSQARWACAGIQIYQVLLGSKARIKEGVRISPNSKKMRAFHGVIAPLQSLRKQSRRRQQTETRSKISHLFRFKADLTRFVCKI